MVPEGASAFFSVHEFARGFVPDLPHALAWDLEVVPDFFRRGLPPISQALRHLDHLCFFPCVLLLSVVWTHVWVWVGTRTSRTDCLLLAATP